MLSIARLGRNREGYYLDKVARGAEEYYTLVGEAPGTWCGGGAAALGLNGTVAEAELSALFKGLDPRTGEALVSGADSPKRRPGFDLTFSAPKGVSLIALLGPPEMARTARQAHVGAVTEALAYLEDTAAFARRGAGGTQQLETSGLVAAAFVHRSSRGADPQLHTHLLVANLVEASDARWSALDAKALYAQARTAGFIYQASVRASLTQRLGLHWAPLRAGMAEPAGFSPAQLGAFSRRRAEVVADMAAHGNTTAAGAQVSAHRTRAPKDPSITPQSLRADWSRRGAEVGLDTPALQALCDHPRSAGLGESRDEVVADLLGPWGLTANESSFDTRAILRSLAARATDGITLAELSEVTAGLITDPEVVALPGAPDPATGGPRWSTNELLAVEAGILASAARRDGVARTTVTPEVLSQILGSRPTLSGEQVAMVRKLTTSVAAVDVVIGRAGTGKTFALETARAAWCAAGFQVIGTALAARAAAELGGATGMPAGTLASLLAQLERPGPEGRLVPGSVVVVDEAGMVGSRELARLLAATQRDGAKVVLIGDPRQLPEIEAGGVLAALAARSVGVVLVENRRQSQPWERDALAELRSGEVSVALAAYRGAGRIVMSDSAPAARASMVADWWQAKCDGASVAMLALRRADVESLNTAARKLMAGAGKLGNEVSLAGMCFAVGDEVLALRNDARIEILNGTRATVATIGPGGLGLIRTDQTTLEVPTSYVEAGHLGHGYAMTIHKAQGATFDRAFVLGSEALYREAGYVAMSRARQASHLYVVSAEVDLESHGADPAAGDPNTALLRALSSSRAKELATDSLVEVCPGSLAAMEQEATLLGQMLLSTVVPDPSDRIAAWVAERERASAAAVGIGQPALLAERDAPARPGAPYASAELARWGAEELGRLEAERPALETLAGAHQRWEAEHVDDLARYGQLRAKLGRGRAALGQALLASPAPHLLDELGTPPLIGLGRAAWADAALRIEAYRSRFGLDDQALAIGDLPAKGLQRAAWEATMEAIEVAHVLISPERARERDGHDLGGPM